ncbi:MAG: GNAT family N-acetyltransferase [bacterium]
MAMKARKRVKTSSSSTTASARARTTPRPKRRAKLEFRPVERHDRATVARICRRTWHGWDYLMLFFNRWVREPDFLGAARAGRLVGFAKATELAPGHWWMEGLRVDPAERHKGIATALSAELLRRTLARSPVSVRLATTDENAYSLAVIRRTGFRELYRSGMFRAAPPPATPGPAPVRVGAEEAGRFLAASRELAANRGLLPHTWHFAPCDRTLLARLARQGALLGYRRGGRLSGLLIVRPHRYRPKDLDISFAGGEDAAVAGFRAYLGRRARRCGTETVSTMAASPVMRTVVRRLGLKPHRGLRRVYVLEYPVAGDQEPASRSDWAGRSSAPPTRRSARSSGGRCRRAPATSRHRTGSA